MEFRVLTTDDCDLCHGKFVITFGDLSAMFEARGVAPFQVVDGLFGEGDNDAPVHPIQERFGEGSVTRTGRTTFAVVPPSDVFAGVTGPGVIQIDTPSPPGPKSRAEILATVHDEFNRRHEHGAPGTVEDLAGVALDVVNIRLREFEARLDQMTRAMQRLETLHRAMPHIVAQWTPEQRESLQILLDRMASLGM